MELTTKEGIKVSGSPEEIFQVLSEFRKHQTGRTPPVKRTRKKRKMTGTGKGGKYPPVDWNKRTEQAIGFLRQAGRSVGISEICQKCGFPYNKQILRKLQKDSKVAQVGRKFLYIGGK